MLAVSIACLSACAHLDGTAAQRVSSTELPAAWFAPLPHHGGLAGLTNWWAQFDDPLLARLINAAERVSPSVAAAWSRIERSRATYVAAGATALPDLRLASNVVRGRERPGQAIANASSASLEASWELDLFGGLAAGARAAEARLNSARSGWHDARVSVAAEVATRYVELRACEQQLDLAIADGNSRAATAQLTETSMRSGLEAVANAELARASAAQGRVSVSQQQTLCELTIKSLVALTGVGETELRSQLAERRAILPRPTEIAVPSVPAETLAQRPDLISAAQELVSASADVAQAQAQRYPRVVLSGNIGPARIESTMTNTSGTVWQLGPLSLILPVFDGGTRRANIRAAEARYDEAAVAYRARLRLAVREIEQALVSLQGVGERTADAGRAAQGFRAALQATEARQRAGMASLFDLESARRSALQAQTTLVDLERERISTWISLYRALGGGWRSDERSESFQTSQVGS
ncbi:MAG: efflux transporter outer membrane subunit [Caldilineaceae bacterium]|nr:efflux transporter outer membrane subunit [Caldilineaceae bacterium]